MPRGPRTHLRFRIEPEMLEQLERAREKSKRTLSGEIAERLKKSLSGQDDLRDYLVEMRRDMMEEIRRELDKLRVDVAQRQDEPLEPTVRTVEPEGVLRELLAYPPKDKPK